jgi:hypothetical protein
MTFSEMQTDALDMIQELQNHPQYSLTKLKHYLNRGNTAFVRETKALENTVEITTVANQFEYTETDKADLAKIYYPTQVRYVEGTENGRPLKTWPGGYTNLPKEYSYGTPYYYWFRNVHAVSTTAPATYTGIRLGTWPIAGTSAMTIKVDGYVIPTELTGDSDVPEYKDMWHDAPVHWAVSKMFGMFAHLKPSWRDKSLFHMSEFERLVSDANEAMSVQSDEPVEMVDVYHQMDNWADI